MSDADTKARKSKWKDAKQGGGPSPEIAKRSSSKKDKPIEIWYRMTPKGFWGSWIKWGRSWVRWGRYRTREEAEIALNAMQRKRPDMYEMEIREE